VKGYDIIVTEPAQADLYEMTINIGRKYEDMPLAGEAISAISDTIDNLVRNPFNNSLVSDEKLVTSGIRRVMIDNYILFYIASEKDKTVSVVRILNFRRYWEDLL
jgi:plasmid stabilization system protein ParE